MRVVRGIAWVAIVLLAVLAFVRTAWVPLLAVAIALVLIPIAWWIAVMLAVRKTEVTLASPSTASKDAGTEIELTVKNASVVPIPYSQVEVAVENLLTSEKETIMAATSIPPRGEVKIPISLASDYCGRICCTLGTVRLFEPLRIFSRRAHAEAERRFTIIPTLYDVHLRDVYAASPLSDTTVFSPYVKGNDLSEVFALREYEEGDELKRIHWKLSEKIDQMIVRDTSLPLDNALLLFWDKRIARDATDAAGRADAMAEVVLALMEQLVRADVTFEIASNDIPSGTCPRAFVSDESEIYEVIGQLLSSPVAATEAAGIEEYRRFYGNLTCSRLIYVGAERPAGIESALGMSQALLFICDGEPDVVAHPQISEIHFPAEGARMALEMAGVM